MNYRQNREILRIREFQLSIPFDTSVSTLNNDALKTHLINFVISFKSEDKINFFSAMKIKVLLFTSLLQSAFSMSTDRKCEEKTEFSCQSLSTNTCLKFDKICSTGTSVWTNYSLPDLSISVDRNMSDNFLLEIQTSMINVTRLRFELRNYRNSTFFRRFFDVGLFRPLHEIADNIRGTI